MEQILHSIPTTSVTASASNRFFLAWSDMTSAIGRWPLWCYLAWNDIKMRYRGSILGPFWITASMMIFIGAFSLVYSKLFHQALAEYVPFLTAGYLVWILISTVVVESCNTFLDAKAFIHEIKLPFMTYVLCLLWRNLLVFGHNFVAFLVIAALFAVHPTWYMLYLIPSLVILFLCLLSIGLLLAMLGTKYRDIPQIVASLMQVAFFITPVSWAPKLLGHSWIVALNPLAYMVDLVRAPLLGQAPQPLTWLVTSSCTLSIFAVAFMLFAKYRRHIPFWL